MRRFLRDNALSLIMFGLFFMSFFFHLVGGASTFNDEAALHGETGK